MSMAQRRLQLKMLLDMKKNKPSWITEEALDRRIEAVKSLIGIQAQSIEKRRDEMRKIMTGGKA